jgi:hypothetical protein
MSGSSCGRARPRAIGCDGAGGCVIVSHCRHVHFSRTVWTTFHCAGTRSSVSVMSSPSFLSRPPQRGHAAGAGSTRRSRGRSAESGRRAGWRRGGVARAAACTLSGRFGCACAAISSDDADQHGRVDIGADAQCPPARKHHLDGARPRGRWRCRHRRRRQPYRQKALLRRRRRRSRALRQIPTPAEQQARVQCVAPATSDTEPPGALTSARIASFCSRRHRHRVLAIISNRGEVLSPDILPSYLQP